MNGIRPPYAAPIERLSILFCTVKTRHRTDAAFPPAAGFVARARLTLLRGAVQIEPF